MRLFIVRHGATQQNLDGRLTGQIDAPLSRLGQRQAEALAARVASWRFDAIIASDLIRARETAAAIATRQGVEVEVDADLREIDMGDWSGRPFAEWTPKERDQFAAMQRDATGNTPAPGGESVRALADRVERARHSAYARYPDGIVLWVTHGGVISVALVHALGLGFDRRQQFRRDNCSIFELNYSADQPLLCRLNDTAHLDALATTDRGEARQAL